MIFDTSGCASTFLLKLYQWQLKHRQVFELSGFTTLQHCNEGDVMAFAASRMHRVIS